MAEEKNMQANQTDDSVDTTSELTELEKLQQKCDEYLNGWQRAKADYSNLKKEAEKKQKEMIEFANAALLADLINVYDNFKLAYQHKPDVESKEWQNWAVGIESIKKQMSEFIKKFGVEEIETVGQKFDPLQHESIEEQEQEGLETGTIIKELKPGYKLHGKLLVPAKVVVAK